MCQPSRVSLGFRHLCVVLLTFAAHCLHLHGVHWDGKGGERNRQHVSKLRCVDQEQAFLCLLSSSQTRKVTRSRDQRIPTRPLDDWMKRSPVHTSHLPKLKAVDAKTEAAAQHKHRPQLCSNQTWPFASMDRFNRWLLRPSPVQICFARTTPPVETVPYVWNRTGISRPTEETPGHMRSNIELTSVMVNGQSKKKESFFNFRDGLGLRR